MANKKALTNTTMKHRERIDCVNKEKSIVARGKRVLVFMNITSGGSVNKNFCGGHDNVTYNEMKNTTLRFSIVTMTGRGDYLSLIHI